jgi:hypothetical protein
LGSRPSTADATGWREIGRPGSLDTHAGPLAPTFSACARPSEAAPAAGPHAQPQRSLLVPCARPSEATAPPPNQLRSSPTAVGAAGCLQRSAVPRLATSRQPWPSSASC